MGLAMSAWWSSFCRTSRGGVWIWRASSRRICSTQSEAALCGAFLHCLQPYQLDNLISLRSALCLCSLGHLSVLCALSVLRLIGDSQTSYWYLALECFLAEYLVQAPRAAPTNNSAANLWLVKFDEWRELKGSNKASPKPAICAVLKVHTSPHLHLLLTPLSYQVNTTNFRDTFCFHAVIGKQKGLRRRPSLSFGQPRYVISPSGG